MARKVLLAVPEVEYPVKIQGSGGDVGFSLGLLYLASFLRENNPKVEVAVAPYRLDRAIGRKRDLEKHFSPFDIIATGACTCESPDALHMMETAKKMGKTTVMGGTFATYNSEPILRTGNVDFIVNGEGELIFSNLIKALDNGNPEQVKGISFIQDNQSITTPEEDLIPDIDTLPIPAYYLIPMHELRQFTSGAIYGARGCPGKCNFCTPSKFWQHTYRHRSIQNIIEEIEILRNYGFNRVHFKDESVGINRKWAMELFGELERLNLGVKLKAKLRPDQFTDELIGQMVRAGIDTIHFGGESIIPNSQESIGKRISEAEIRNAYATLERHGCKANGVYIFGLPGETPEDLITNADFITETGVSPDAITYISFITPHPGTDLAEDPDNQLRILTQDHSRYTHKQPVAVPESLGPQGLKLIADTYHEVAEATNTQDVNPKLDEAYLASIS